MDDTSKTKVPATISMEEIRAANSPQNAARLEFIQGHNKPTANMPKIMPPASPNIENAI